MVLHSLHVTSYTHGVMKKVLQQSFYKQDTHIVAKNILGKVLTRRQNNITYTGRITEVEAYVGEDDLACHASKGKTKRTKIMYGAPGHAYVYLIYGMYHCVNIVTEPKNFPAAVLIRALEPLSGIEQMHTLRHTHNIHNLTTGPGKLCQAMNITREHNGIDVTKSKELYITDDGFSVDEKGIISTPRIGVEYAKHCAAYPWRYYIKNSEYISKK